MKTVYFIYAGIEEKAFNHLKYMINNVHSYSYSNEKYYGLYAWTLYKSDVEEFLDVREKSIYTVVKKKFEFNDDFKAFKRENIELQLSHYEYVNNADNNNKSTIEILSTKNEYVTVTIDGSEYIDEFSPSVDRFADYHYFNTKLIEALDKIGYTTEYNIVYGSDEEIDSTSYNCSFGLTTYGSKLIDFSKYEVNLLLYLYYYMFYGKIKD